MLIVVKDFSYQIFKVQNTKTKLEKMYICTYFPCCVINFQTLIIKMLLLIFMKLPCALPYFWSLLLASFIAVFEYHWQ